LKGEDPANPDEFHAKDSFISAKLRKKLIIIVGGVSMNLLTAWVIFTLLFRHGTQPLGISSEPTSESYLITNLAFLQEAGFASGNINSGIIVKEITPNALAEEIGLQTGDIILEVNGEEATYQNLTTLLSQGSYGENALTVQTIDGNIATKPFSCGEDCKL
jgi:membrane-associated protease RseP (regulator of RpoE activity)